ncbi:MAG: DUF4293 domain-containing protein [Paludibacteraceae bacterium]|nr:DUF4293 domain-containing protein [Paludibacteraceae bacterium]
MIQRIQTIYLFISVIFLLFVACNDCVRFFNAETIDVCSYSVMDFPVTMTIHIIIMLLTFGSIFLYKKRVCQMRVIALAIILILLNSATVAVYVAADNFDGYKISITWATFLSVGSLIMDFLAIKAIGVDEAKIRSLNRLR